MPARKSIDGRGVDRLLVEWTFAVASKLDAPMVWLRAFVMLDSRQFAGICGIEQPSRGDIPKLWCR